MAGDWIKMRPSLLTSPKVNGIARILEDSLDVGCALTTGFRGPMSEIVTRNVMRNVTVASLLVIWGAANEHTDDGVFRNADLSDLDDMVGIPGFGSAMAAVGWAKFDPESSSVSLPNFSEYNTCGRDRAKEKNAERQRRFRENHNAKSNVTHNVTNNDREEERREEKRTTQGLRLNLPHRVEAELPAEKRASRFALGQLPDDWAAFCRSERPDLDPDETFHRFADYWRARPGKDGRKLDWAATWRNWCRNERYPPSRVDDPASTRRLMDAIASDPRFQDVPS
ncbi:phage protein [Burkholderiales bacterium GJ-E10]|nr:phage protein [Burkholderiales bacterium GJ-E10]